MSDMKDSTQESTPSTESTRSQKAKRREGDSALARFYRSKDEILDWTMGQIACLSKDKHEVFMELTRDYFIPIYNLHQVLESSPEDEETLSKVISVMKALSKRAGEVGLRDYPSKNPPSDQDPDASED